MDKRFKKMALVRLILIMQNTLCTWRINIFIHQVRPGLLNKEMLNFCALLEIQNMYSICLRLRHFWCKTCFHFSIHLLSDYEVHFRNDFGIAMIFNIMFHFILSFRLTASPLMNPHPPPPSLAFSLLHLVSSWFSFGDLWLLDTRTSNTTIIVCYPYCFPSNVFFKDTSCTLSCLLLHVDNFHFPVTKILHNSVFKRNW